MDVDRLLVTPLTLIVGFALLAVESLPYYRVFEAHIALVAVVLRFFLRRFVPLALELIVS